MQSSAAPVYMHSNFAKHSQLSLMQLVTLISKPGCCGLSCIPVKPAAALICTISARLTAGTVSRSTHLHCMVTEPIASLWTAALQRHKSTSTLFSMACMFTQVGIQVHAGPAMESSHGCYGGLLGENQVRCLLVESYTSEFQLRNFKSCRSRQSEKRSAELPPPDRHGKISAFGSFFGLEGFDAVVRQVHRALLRLHIGVEDTSEFARSLQLLRLVAAPGLGKVRCLLGHAAESCNS